MIEWIVTAGNTGIGGAVVLAEFLDAIGTDIECINVGIDVLPLEMSVF